jgi:hypothetical protein
MESSEYEMEGAYLNESSNENGWMKKSKEDGTQKRLFHFNGRESSFERKKR